MVVVSVKDRGAGIDAAEAKAIFTRFYGAERTARRCTQAWVSG
jgi:signal transduction histidine kinase